MYDEFIFLHTNSMCSADSLSFDEVEIGRKLGHDLFRFGRTLEIATSPHAVAEGFLQAHGQNVRQVAPDRFTRKWLQLRLNALTRGRHVDANVTPELIEAIDVAQCPVLRVALTHGELRDSDWSVDRLNNDGAYAASNLAVMSVAANRAKGARSFEGVYALSRSAGSSDNHHGLQPAQWLRLAALMLGPCFAPRPGAAPTIPLVVPIPKFTVREAMQMVQYVFTIKAGRPAGKNLLIKAFAQACEEARYRTKLCFLAESVHVGLKGVEVPWDVWLSEPVMSHLTDWRRCLDDTAWGKAGEIARSLAGGQQVSVNRLDAWHLGTRGYLR